MVVVAAVLSLPGAAVAEGNGGGDGGENADVPLTEFLTTSTVRNIQAVQAECSGRDKIYQLDCLRQGLELVWRRLPYHGDYGPMREAIQQASTAMARIIDANADTSTPRLDSGLNANSRFQARRHYTPILEDKLASASSATRQALGNLETSLDDLGQKSAIWDQNYSRIATLVRQIAAHLP
jgi:hypothetical protein